MTRAPVERFKTSVVVMGERQVDEFQALCALLGRRPHQLAADMVLTEIRRYRRRKHVAEAVRHLVDARRAWRERKAIEPIDLNAYRKAHR
ncbi:MAG TPA: hypothetical protein VGL39_27635 [Jatrophihabitantaceae bacterium]